MKYKKTDKKIGMILITSIVLILFFSGLSMGKQNQIIKLENNSKIATPIFIVENGEQVNIDNNINKGIYIFTVKNYDNENNVSQVDMEYYIEILTKIDNNISFKIYKEDAEIDIKENRTEKFTMDKNINQDDKYKIEIICDEQKRLENLLQEIQIKVHSEQKKG